MSQKKVKQRSGSDFGIVKNIIISAVGGLITFVIFLSVFSLIIVKCDISQAHFWIFAVASSSLSALICAFISSVRSSRKSLMLAMICVIMLLLIEFITFLCFNNVSPNEKIYIMIPAMLIFGFFGCVIGINIKKK